MKKPEFILDKELYDYELPEELIGTEPREKRDESRLFVFNTKTGEITFDLFKNIPKHLPEKSLMILNETRVAPARVFLKKPTGGKVEVLFLVNEWKQGSDAIEGIVDREILIGDILTIDEYRFEVISQKEYIFVFKLLFAPTNLVNVLEKYGTMPVPKYIKGTQLTEEQLRNRYQTVFAGHTLSLAAPTASLHFTSEVFEDLKKKEIEINKISLDIGLGTFKPISEENIQSNSLHNERFTVSDEVAKNIDIAKKERTPVVAVGTTAVRALESHAKGITDSTNIFIHPPFNFRVVDVLVTNFHLPNSSLMMLVEAFLQHKKSPKHLVELYQRAIEEKFRFYSFGDSMLII